MPEHEIIDGSIMNEISLQRYIRREVRLMLELFEEYDQALSKLLRKSFRSGDAIGSRRFKTLLRKIKSLRSEMIGKARVHNRASLEDVSKVEHDKEWALLLGALSLTEKSPTRSKVSESLKHSFSTGSSSASTLSEWWSALLAADYKRIKDAITLIASQQGSVDDAVRLVIGTESQKFRDGVSGRSRNNVRALVATAIAHVVQFAREHLWRLVPSTIGMMWISILDGRTTAICRSRDNKVVMFGDNIAPDGVRLLSPQGARPPAHPNCRSRMMAIVHGMEVQIRESFDEFLRAQTPANQNKILGDTKAGMFRRGEVTLDDFVDDIGNEFTIKQLRAA